MRIDIITIFPDYFGSGLRLRARVSDGRRRCGQEGAARSASP